ncbi:MAG: heat-inducible transcriptional repressor HrcA [Bacillota bacterium]|nr:heat-inducible transcriptional repressor HrcA [Bacillota bacterium]
MPKEPSRLDERKRTILRAVVDEYVEHAEPVGSRSLVERYSLNLSSASVRSTLAELEQLGYLEQPHTSAGRVPTDRGYRIYIDELMELEPLPEETKEHIREQLRESIDEIPELLRQASGLLSQETGYVSLALQPRVASSVLRQIKLLMIEPGRVLVVLVLSAGVVRDRIVRIPDVLDQHQLQRIAAAIEQQLAGCQLRDISFIMMQLAAADSQVPESLLNQVLFETWTAIQQADQLAAYVDGMPNLLRHREFHSISRARDVVSALSSDGLLTGLMEPLRPAVGSSGHGGADAGALAERSAAVPWMVRIGQELQQEGLEDCSFVTTTYHLPEQLVGSIGVVGPRRMAYSRVISHISFVRQTIDHLLTWRSSRS